MGRIICLANSKKEGERCIAGIDVRTGQWVRPVSKRQDGAIAWGMRTINGEEPQILDILEIPLENGGPDEGFQPENKLLKDGPWKRIGSIQPEELLKYCEKDSVVLHNDLDSIPFTHFKLIPKRNWKSLQLVHSKNVDFYIARFGTKVKYRAKFSYRKRIRSLDLRVTDLAFIERLKKDKKISKDCILTISLAMPWSPNNSTEKSCYKLVAGVVEL